MNANVRVKMSVSEVLRIAHGIADSSPPGLRSMPKSVDSYKRWIEIYKERLVRQNGNRDKGNPNSNIALKIKH